MTTIRDLITSLAETTGATRTEVEAVVSGPVVRERYEDIVVGDAEYERLSAMVLASLHSEPTTAETDHVHGWLCDYRTSDRIRHATPAEHGASESQAHMDGGRGVIEVDGRSVYVEE